MIKELINLQVREKRERERESWKGIFKTRVMNVNCFYSII